MSKSEVKEAIKITAYPQATLTSNHGLPHAVRACISTVFFGKSISQLNVASVIKKIKIYEAKYLFLKNVNQVLRHLKS